MKGLNLTNRLLPNFDQFPASIAKVGLCATGPRKIRDNHHSGLTGLSSSNDAQSCLRIMVSKLDLNRERIRQLYFDKGMKLNDVIVTMKVEELIASKKWYERHLKAWNIRKNSDQKAKAFLKITLDQRKRRGLDSLFLIQGTHLSKLEVERATSRCFVASSVLYSGEVRELPPGVIAITPTTEGYMYVVYVLPQKNEADGIEGDLRQLIFMPPQILKKIISAIATGHGGGNCRGLARVYELLSLTLPVEEDEHSLDVLRYILSGNNATPSVELLKITVYFVVQQNPLRMQSASDLRRTVGMVPDGR
ncbi:uncharacterized protein RSE6_07629 [Rhynchosporium secalis]|uniref:Clr5 domain-containing protein n=1 Tax=Rhynchosporium secalis TaxID=38038 RepID=A0A1E1MDE9_RHYSE|nr:uncharacterized protein RSE6_07629 [Rhynchosporium secalis]